MGTYNGFFPYRIAFMYRSPIYMNIVTSFILQIVTFISGLIIPNLILNRFGSDVNGLVNSLNQFLSFATLLEGGLGSVVLASLYEPLIKKDNIKTAGILKSANKFFIQLGIFFFVYCVGVILLYPQFVRSHFSAGYVGTLGLILCANLIVQYYLSITNRLLLEADQKGYIVYIIQTVIIMMVTILTMIFINTLQNIHGIKMIRMLVYLIQPLSFSLLVKKHYTLPVKVAYDEQVLHQRWSGLAQNIAFFIHSNTDVIMLTLFTDLKSVSVYSVYSMIVIGVRTVIITIKNGFFPVLGKCLALKDNKRLEYYFDIYEFIIFNISTVAFGCTASLITSFVMIYTKGVHDVNYDQPVFALLITFAEFTYCIREPYISVDYADGRFKETRLGAFIEVAINLMMSLFLVIRYGLPGIAFGTLLAMISRLIYHVLYNKYHVIHRSVRYFVKRVYIMVVCWICFFIITRIIRWNVITYTEWFLLAGCMLLVYSMITLICNAILDKPGMKKVFDYIGRKQE